MQYIFDCIENIEDIITQNLKYDELICILIECLLSPYKAKIVFDEFYEKKNFLNEALQSRLDKYNKDNNVVKNLQNSINAKNKTEKNNQKDEDFDIKDLIDKETMLLPYFENNEKNEKKNEDSTKDSLTINKLLIHPFYSENNLDESFLKKLFKTENIKKEEE